MEPRTREGNWHGQQAPDTMDQRSPQSAQLGSPQTMRSANVNRAQRFEDEKKRITATCFAKKEEDGKLAQSYITHIRVEEDGLYPSSPPPPDAPQQNKKARVVILAVKSNGRVAMHKARENDDSSFQIGKTWPLDELQAIESFSNNLPKNAEEQQRSQWAGPLGFLITMSKPYYWKANTAKEKEFFIGSLAKVYGKFTNGKIPQLIGFDPQDRQQIANLGGSQGGGGPRMSSGSTNEPSFGSPVQPRPQHTVPINNTVTGPSRAGPTQQRPPSPNRRPQNGTSGDRQQQQQQQHQQQQQPVPRPQPPAERSQYAQVSPEIRPPPIQDPALRQVPSRERMRPPKVQPPPASVASRETPPTQYADYSELRKTSAPSSSVPPSTASVDSQRSQQNAKREGSNGVPSTGVGNGTQGFAPVAVTALGNTKKNFTPTPGFSIGAGIQSSTPIPGPPPSTTNRGFTSIPGLTTGAGPQSFTSIPGLSQNATNQGFPSLPAQSTNSNVQGFTAIPGLSTGLANQSSSQNLASSAIAGQWRPPTAPPKQLQPQTQVAPESPGRDRAPVARNVESGQWQPNNGDRQAVPERRRPPIQDPDSIATQKSSNKLPGTDSVKPLILNTPPKVKSSMQTQTGPNPGQGVASMVQQGAYASSPSTVVLPERAAARTAPGKAVPAMAPAVSALPGPSSTPVNEAVRKEDAPAVVQQSNGATASIPDEPSKEQGPSFRPGLGPMMGGQKSTTDVVGKFRKAALAHSAFKPRAGGAGDRLLINRTETSNEPDGITGVVPAPSLARGITQDTTQPLNINKAPIEVAQPLPEVPIQEDPQKTPHEIPAIVLPTDESNVEVGKTNPSQVAESLRVSPPKEEASLPTMPSPPPAPPSPISKAPVKPRSSKYQQGLRAMGIDPSVLEGLDLSYETVLEDLGWDTGPLAKKSVDTLESGLRREIGKLEAGSWLNSSDQRFERVEYVEKMLDKAIMECDEMEGLLTLYGVELSTLNDDISYIEAQSQGLQVQTANQKLLQMELQNLVQTTSISPAQIKPLRQTLLGDPGSLEIVERCLLMLFKAINTIDPSLLRNKTSSPINEFHDGNVTDMRALQEKKQFYLDETLAFVERFRKFMDPTFAKTMDSITKDPKPSGRHDAARQALWQYSPLMMFVKDVNLAAWENVIHAYQARSRPVYQEEVRSSIAGWKSVVRKPVAEEQDALFTTHDKEGDNSTGSVKRLTVKRSQTLTRGFSSRAATSDKRLELSKNQDSKLLPYEVFTGALEEIVPLMTVEQNFVIDFFHISSTEKTDFADLVTGVRPSERRGTNLSARRPQEPDKAMIKRTMDVMESVFSAWPVDMQNLVDWAVGQDAFQGIGILHVLERKRHEVSSLAQEFAANTLRTLSENLKLRTNRFVDEQVKAIDDTKVKIKKRKGIIVFIRTFPNFSATIESSLPPSSSLESAECPETRALVDTAYQRINKAMFDSLRFIAKEAPNALTTIPTNVGYSSSHADPEDKEALNHHILLIENMQYFVSTVDERSNPVLGQWCGQAYMELSEHLAAYVSTIIRRPLGRIIDFLDSIENIMSTSAGRDAPERIPKSHPSHSRSVFKKVVGAYDAKEMRRGIDTLKRRIEKHFAEADDAATSQKLEKMICEECERRYNNVVERMQKVAREVYEGSVEVEFSKTDVSQAFRRI